MKISQEDLFDSDLYEEISNEITDHRRWSVVHTIIVKRIEDGTFWKGRFERGATENQDASDYYDSDVEMTQVFPHPAFTVVYLTAKEIEAA